MTETYPFELSDLPTGGPAARDDVKRQLSIELDDATDDAFIDAIVEAVNELIRGLPTAERSQGQESWAKRTVTGANMLAARLVRRRNSPEGVATFNDAGAVYVQRNDPDVALLLELGKSARPAVG